jgi:hypothetical protein
MRSFLGGVMLVVLGVFCIFPTFFVLSSYLPTREVMYPLPHQIPKYPDGISFRLAMVHDVIHDRYPRHGKAYYQERNRLALAALADVKDADGLPVEKFGLIDDLGVGLDAVGEYDDAVRWLRLKLQAQQKLGYHGSALYTSYANLGTFLIHGSAPRAFRGDKEAQERVREGLRYLHKSIEVNPQAHFGREIWQAVIAEYMLAASTDRQLLLKYDMIGNSLQSQPVHYGMTVRGFRAARNIEAFLRDPKDEQTRIALRHLIAHVGAEGSWTKEVDTSHKESVSFDEPCLGIIGMWRLGGGANPHFCLALAETMTRINQRHLAWSAYQRAFGEAQRFCPEEEIRAKFVEHCRSRQERFGFSEQEAQELRQRFQSELLIGQEYQHNYQKYEEEQIKAGKDVNDPHFHDAFHARNANIATPIGQADFVLVSERIKPQVVSLVVFILGLVAFVTLILVLRWKRTTASAGQN